MSPALSPFHPKLESWTAQGPSARSPTMPASRPGGNVKRSGPPAHANKEKFIPSRADKHNTKQNLIDTLPDDGCCKKCASPHLHSRRGPPPSPPPPPAPPPPAPPPPPPPPKPPPPPPLLPPRHLPSQVCRGHRVEEGVRQVQAAQDAGQVHRLPRAHHHVGLPPALRGLPQKQER